MEKNRVTIEYEGRRVESYADCDGEVLITKGTLTIKRSSCPSVQIDDLSGIDKITFTPEVAILRLRALRERDEEA